MIPIIYLSYRMDLLVDRLIQELDVDRENDLQMQTLLVPHSQMKQWLLLEIAKRKGIAMGLRVMEVERFFSASLNPLEMFCICFKALSECTDPELLRYLQGKKGRLLMLAEQLASLFFTYGQFAPYLFDPKAEAMNWQHALIKKLFVHGPWRLPVQLDHPIEEPVWCFGIDYTPFWNCLFRAPKLSVFLFSPCQDFWADFCSNWERKKLNRYWKKRGAAQSTREEMDAYLRDSSPLLANWGKLGRETLKVFDNYDFQMEEIYPPFQPESLLKKIQFNLLHLETAREQSNEKENADGSVKVFLTGSSRHKELECLRDEILRLQIPYHEISVLAPEIEPYVPLIEFVFGDQIPYRISKFDIAPQSSFRQGLIRLLQLSQSRWEAEEILTLFETPAFYRKQGWDEEKLDLFRQWIDSAHIKWGINGTHREGLLVSELGQKKTFEDRGSWEKGLGSLLEALIYLKPLQINADAFEEFLTVVLALMELPLKGEKTLASWAGCLEKIVADFLQPDLSDETDAAALHSFRQFLQDLRLCREKSVFPFAAVQRLALRPCFGQIHSSHLHAIRFSSIEEGALLPVRALFLIGMDEESFPRSKIPSSLDLLKGKKVSESDRDRYLFLQALFSAQEFLRISYSHLSLEEGKPANPSLLVQELLSTIGTDISTIYHSCVSKRSTNQNFFWPKSPSTILPEGEITIPFSDLRQLARHPWKFYLQKVHGIYLNEALKESFTLQKGPLLRATLEKPVEEILTTENLPLGLLGEAMKLEILEKGDEWKKQLSCWGAEPFTLIFRENCSSLQQEGNYYIAPPLVFTWEKLKVQLVGEIKHASAKGLICTYTDKVEGLLKVWPEALAVSLSLNAPQVLILESGKIKTLTNVQQQLKTYIEYYFRCLSAPSPLLNNWADAFLRKGEVELEKTIKKGSFLDDPIIDWVLARTEIVPQEMVENWGSYLKEAFSGLADLYPTRGKSQKNATL